MNQNIRGIVASKTFQRLLSKYNPKNENLFFTLFQKKSIFARENKQAFLAQLVEQFIRNE